MPSSISTTCATARGALTDDESCALAHVFGVGYFVEDRPRQTGLVFAVEVDDKV
jgi:hypothetical protein